MAAAQEGHLSVVELLVSVGPQVHSQKNVSTQYVHFSLQIIIIHVPYIIILKNLANMCIPYYYNG